MKKHLKYICGILSAAVVVGGGNWQTAPSVFATETSPAEESGEAGESISGGKAESAEGTLGDGAEEMSPPESSQEEGSTPGDGALPESSQEEENTPGDKVSPESSQEEGSTPGDGVSSESSQEEGSTQGDESLPESSQDEENTQGDEVLPESSQEEGNIPGSAGGDTISGEGENSSEENTDAAEWVRAAGEELIRIAGERDIMALVYLRDEYPVRREPSHDSETAADVLSGQLVNILDVRMDENGEIWHYVKFEYKGLEMNGYVQRSHLACSDNRFLEWEENYGMNHSAQAYTIDGEAASVYPDIAQFPESYRPALTALKEKHPTWTFVKMNTTLDWETSIYQELQNGKSLVYKTFPDWAKDGLYDDGNWYYATDTILRQYMDPRNNLTEDAIFQFEQLTYNEACHTLEAVAAFLNNTFMNDSSPAPDTDMTYAQIFWNIGREEGRKVSPFHLAARVLQEQGAGTSPLISGRHPGYEGYYNYFNIGATGTTSAQVITSGLNYAKNHGWQGAYHSIAGGADFISGNYIKKGQDTLYLQKFNVNPNGAYAPYTHQYMQNISAPTTEGLSIKRLYAGAGALESTFVFKIPVYENMPGEPGNIPAVSTNVELTLPEGYGGTAVWLDGRAWEGTLQDGKLTVTAPDVNAKTAVVYKYNEAGVPAGMYVWSLRHDGTAYTATPEPELEDLLTYHGFSIRITGKSGIRFKTGISADLRARLLSTGVNGYRLKEYGTLVMNEANMSRYPMVKDGEKVAGGISYGVDANGNLQDVIFEEAEGRYRFASVLVGVPVEQYKAQYAFRGYAVLEKDGVQVILYGPHRASSIYTLAGILLERGNYEPGTEAHAFLQKIITDADALESLN